MPKTSKQTASETYEAGAAYHTPAVLADTELIEFSPTAEYRRTMECVGHNVAVMQEV